MQTITRQIAAEIKVSESQVKAAVELLDGGATVQAAQGSAMASAFAKLQGLKK